jgi:hypothetical protein|tara:strand:- start:445 stop:1158 length:714 start_codon:yes stop_codon:yes gene_type:complete
MNELQDKVWVCFPSVMLEKAKKAASRWREKGYRVGVYVQDSAFIESDIDWVGVGMDYQGYWWACDRIVRAVESQGAEIFILAADDMDPDPNHTAEEIAAEYLERFPDGFGVMQPCGDRQGMDSTGKPAAARICGSPWFGKGWVEKAFGGEYVVPTEFFHFYGDEVLKEVAERLGVLWMRDDLIQDHQHWAFGRQRKEKYQEDNSRNHWQEDKNRFMTSQKDGFEDYLEKFKKPEDSY